MKKKNSSVEVLRIIALFLITISHCVMSTSYDTTMTSLEGTSVFLSSLRFLGSFGNLIFIIVSSYYLVGVKEIKRNKVIQMILDSFVLSMLFLILFVGVFHIEVPMGFTLKQFMPVFFNLNWFVTCYLLFYSLVPYLNMIIHQLNKEQHFRIVFVFFILYCCLQFVFKGYLYINKLLGFIVVYFFVAFMKLYMPHFQTNKKLNLILVLSGLFLHYGFFLLINYLGTQFSFLSDKALYLDNVCNPFMIMTSISLFNLCHSIHFFNGVIDQIDSISLYYYLIHENSLFRLYIRPLFFQNSDCIIGSVFLYSFLIFIVGILLALLYKKVIAPLTGKLSCFLLSKIKSIYHWVQKLFFSIC